MKRRSFLKGLLGVAAIPYVGWLTLPAPAPISLMEAALATRKKLIDGVVENLTSVNRIHEWTMENWYD